MKELAKIKAHQRNIRIETFDTGGPLILVVGELHDERHSEYYLLSGEKRPSGTIHRMIVRMLVNPDTMVIEDCELEMPGVPRDECGELAGSLSVIRGLSITRGFSLKVKSLLGGVNGCTHVMSLVIEMAPAALQGLWAIKSQRPMERSDLQDDGRLKRFSDVLLNTCRIWREDGPSYRKLLEDIEKFKSK